MEDWKDDLKIHQDDIINNHTYILTIKWWIIAWYTTFIFKENGMMYIKNLFIHKDYLRNWYWSLLLNFIKQEWKNQWVLEIYLESDKNAMNFYLKNWFLVSWKSKDSWLPIMKCSLWNTQYLDIIDTKTDTVIWKALKEEVYEKKLPHRIVHVIVTRSNWKILLQKRSHLARKYPHTWVTSACGHVSSGESYEEAAQKELFEEIGLKWELLSWPKFLYNSEQWMMKLITIFYLTSDDPLILEDKVSEVQEFTKEKIYSLPKDTLHPELTYIIKKKYI